jgi:hypothetical protein
VIALAGRIGRPGAEVLEVAFDHVHGADQLFWGDLIEAGGRMSEGDALQHASDVLGTGPQNPVTRLRGLDYIELVGGEVRITAIGWRHVRHAYDHAVRHGYDR